MTEEGRYEETHAQQQHGGVCIDSDSSIWRTAEIEILRVRICVSLSCCNVEIPRNSIGLMRTIQPALIMA